MDKLNEAYCGIIKAQKAASALQGRAEQMLDESSQKFKVAFDGMLQSMEASEQLACDLGFLIKFKKSRSKQPLTIPLAQGVLRMVASSLQDLLDSSKSLKALMPKKE